MLVGTPRFCENNNKLIKKNSSLLYSISYLQSVFWSSLMQSIIYSRNKKIGYLLFSLLFLIHLAVFFFRSQSYLFKSVPQNVYLWKVSPLPVIKVRCTVTKVFNFYMFRPCLLLWLLRFILLLVTESSDFLLVYKTHQVWLLSKLVACVVPEPRILFPLFTERVIFI